jgi:protein SCO1/2
MFKNKSYIGISFIILVFGIYAVPKILNRIQQGEVVKGDRLDKVNAVSSGVRKLEIIGPAPKFELVNQNNLKGFK